MADENVMVAVGSYDQAKLEAVQSACALIFGKNVIITSYVVSPCMNQQPFGDRECKQGAIWRAMRAANEYSNADYFVGIESGICDCEGIFFDRAWVAIRRKTYEWSYSQSASIMIPLEVVRYLREHPDDGLGRLVNVKEEYADLATNNMLDRTLVLTQAVICAFAPFVNPSFFEKLKGAVQEQTKQ